MKRLASMLAASLFLLGVVHAQKRDDASLSSIVNEGMRSHFSVSQSVTKNIDFQCRNYGGSYTLAEEEDHTNGFYTVRLTKLLVGGVTANAEDLRKVNNALAGPSLLKGDFSQCNNKGVIVKFEIYRQGSKVPVTDSENLYVVLQIVDGHLAEVTTEKLN